MFYSHSQFIVKRIPAHHIQQKVQSNCGKVENAVLSRRMACSQERPLQEEDGAEHSVCHGGRDQHAEDVGEPTAGLWQGADVGDRVEDAAGREHAEVKQSGGEIWISQSVKQADEEEGNDVLQVVVVTPAG